MTKRALLSPERGLHFLIALSDARRLVSLYDEQVGGVKRGPQPEQLDALRRSALILVVTAWETYVEDALRDILDLRLREASDSSSFAPALLALAEIWLASKQTPATLLTWTDGGWRTLLKTQFEAEIASLHTPSPANIARLFRRYAGFNPVREWRWQGSTPAMAAKRLEGLLARRGRLAHQAHRFRESHTFARRGEAVKAIEFVGNLFRRTEHAVEQRFPSLGPPLIPGAPE